MTDEKKYYVCRSSYPRNKTRYAAKHETSSYEEAIDMLKSLRDDGYYAWIEDVNGARVTE